MGGSVLREEDDLPGLAGGKGGGAGHGSSPGVSKLLGLFWLEELQQGMKTLKGRGLGGVGVAELFPKSKAGTEWKKRWKASQTWGACFRNPSSWGPELAESSPGEGGGGVRGESLGGSSSGTEVAQVGSLEPQSSDP